MILSFNGRANIGIRKAQEKHPELKLLEVRGASDGLVSDPNKLDQIEVAFMHGDRESALIKSTGFSEFGEVELIPKLMVGDFIMEWPIDMELLEAQQLKEAAGFVEPYNRVTLRNISDPRVNPCFIFNSQSSGFIYVDIITKKVSQGEAPHKD